MLHQMFQKLVELTFVENMNMMYFNFMMDPDIRMAFEEMMSKHDATVNASHTKVCSSVAPDVPKTCRTYLL